MLAIGNQRSYSDVCIPVDKTIIKAPTRIFDFNADKGIIIAGGGATLGQAAKAAKGWFLPVTPGTRHATVGGCIANDVHGKNHQTAGSFGNHIRAIYLWQTGGRRSILYPEHPLFSATIGGLGLTGCIDRAEIQLVRQSRALKPWYWPLDYIPYYWPIYKRLGFWQYHCVVPEPAVKPLLREVTQRPLLVVHKRFGDVPSLGMLSFCRPGISLSLDFARPDAGMMKRLDQAVIDCGGAVYPAKTSMSAEMFRHSFPRWKEFAQYVDPSFSSEFWRRVSAGQGQPIEITNKPPKQPQLSLMGHWNPIRPLFLNS